MTIKERLKTTRGVLCAILVLVIIWIFYSGCQLAQWQKDAATCLKDMPDPPKKNTTVNDQKLPDSKDSTAGGTTSLSVDPETVKTNKTDAGTGGTQSTGGQGGGHTQ